MSSNDAYLALMHRGIAVRSGDPVGMPGFLRISIGTPQENAALIAALDELMEEWVPRAEARAAEGGSRWTIAVRQGGPPDHPFVLDLGRRVAMTSVSSLRPAMRPLVELSYDKLLEFVLRQSHVVLVACDDDRRLGFLLLLDQLPDEVTMAPQAFVAYMAVEEFVARRQGVGRALLEAAEAIARERGLPNLAMMVTEENTAALELYTSCGYQTERRLLCKPL